MSQSGGTAATATAGSHSLAFRVMRLCRPSLNVDPPLRLHPSDLFLDVFNELHGLGFGEPCKVNCCCREVLLQREKS
ncbi:hypothetical protein RIF29_19890 [Crotalaria pallida]|uniref:Uncharacterized protein n=1 Tax=Crotalaria pallida TaxID=3830 RepID=A0AAN9F4K0_CROPI